MTFEITVDAFDQVYREAHRRGYEVSDLDLDVVKVKDNADIIIRARTPTRGTESDHEN